MPDNIIISCQKGHVSKTGIAEGKEISNSKNSTTLTVKTPDGIGSTSHNRAAVGDEETHTYKSSFIVTVTIVRH